MMTEQPTKAMALVDRQVMQNLGPHMVREIWVDEDDHVWWRLLNTKSPRSTPYRKGDPR